MTTRTEMDELGRSYKAQHAQMGLKPATYTAFKAWAIANGLSVRQLRCDDARPTEEMIEVMDRLGLEKYERFVLCLERESSK
jgi:hypothetical protein